MLASRRTRRVVHHEWTMDKPAHFTDVLQAIEVADRQRGQESVRATDLMVTADDEQIVIGYSVEEPS